MQANQQKVEFGGSQGARLAGLLDLPAGPVRAVALFAHCFTCSKDILAAARIARGLNRHGIAVLRFDFTGLGASGGEFANSNFSSNIADLVAAADHLRDSLRAPDILIGHSLGGAAVLAAAHEIAEARAVATIGAPADADHVAHNFAARLDEIERDGAAELTLAGRTFTIKKQFLDDVRGRNMKQRIAGLKKALLVMHGPRDDIVGIDNAGAIFSAARHPKSFISLDDADHLLSRAADAAYVADILASWAARYVPAPQAAAATGEDGTVTVAETGIGKFQQTVTVGSHSLLADEPVSVGGTDTGPTPYDLLAAALGACTSMTLRMYAERKGIELGPICVKIGHDKVHAKDCTECAEGREGRIDRFERTIAITGGVPAGLEEKIVEIAGKCPVHRTLEASSVVVTTVAQDG